MAPPSVTRSDGVGEGSNHRASARAGGQEEMPQKADETREAGRMGHLPESNRQGSLRRERASDGGGELHRRCKFSDGELGHHNTTADPEGSGLRVRIGSSMVVPPCRGSTPSP